MIRSKIALCLKKKQSLLLLIFRYKKKAYIVFI